MENRTRFDRNGYLYVANHIQTIQFAHVFSNISLTTSTRANRVRNIHMKSGSRSWCVVNKYKHGLTYFVWVKLLFEYTAALMILLSFDWLMNNNVCIMSFTITISIDIFLFLRIREIILHV